MTTKYFVYPYTTMSAGSIVLAEELDAKRVKLTGSNYVHKPENVLINWGNGDCPHPQALNPACAIGDVINKKTFFTKVNGSCPSLPKYATSKVGAATNLTYPIVCRTSVEGSDGQGIVIAETAAQLVQCGLYTEYKDKTSEYRIHLGRLPNGEVTVIARQKKSLSPNFTGDKRIWTGPETKMDWIETAVSPVVYAAKEVFAKFPGLTFGALDIVYNNSTEQAWVLEINSAPMMSAAVAEAYGEFFRNYKGNATVAPTTSVEGLSMGEIATAVDNLAAASTPAPALSGAFTATDLIKLQLSAGHISQATLMAAYTPPQPTTEELITNYVSKLTN